MNDTEWKIKRISYIIRLIEMKPNDIELLKKEYYELTGKKYNRKGALKWIIKK